MNPSLVYEILQLALSLAQSLLLGKAQQDATVANTLLQIVQKGVQAYSQATGAPMDVSLIKFEEEVL